MDEAVPLAEFASLIPGSARAALPRGELRACRLRGGRGINLCLRIDSDSSPSMVLRLRRGPELAGADPRRELASQQLAAQAGLAPAILAVDINRGWTLMEYVARPPWTAARLGDEASLVRLCERLRRLHSLKVPAFAPMDGLALLQSHCRVLERQGNRVADPLLQRGGELAWQLEQLPRRPAVLCHGDPDVENFLGDSPVLIDFEYAQVADATYDLALLLVYYPSLEPRTEALLVAMGLDDPLSRGRLPLQMELCRLINDAWAQAQALLGPLD